MEAGIPLEWLQSFISDDEASLSDYLTPEVLAGGGAALPMAAGRSSVGVPPNVTPDADGYYGTRGTMFATKRDTDDFARTGSLVTGDNGIGYFRGVKTDGSVPYVALPRDMIDPSGKPDPSAVLFAEVFTPQGKRHVVEVGDVLPKVKNLKNGTLDLNPAAAKLFGTGDASGYRWRLLPNRP